MRDSPEFDGDRNYKELYVTLIHGKLKTALFAWILKAALLLAGPPPPRSLLLCVSGEIIFEIICMFRTGSFVFFKKKQI